MFYCANCIMEYWICCLVSYSRSVNAHNAEGGPRDPSGPANRDCSETRSGESELLSLSSSSPSSSSSVSDVQVRICDLGPPSLPVR